MVIRFRQAPSASPWHGEAPRHEYDEELRNAFMELGRGTFTPSWVKISRAVSPLKVRWASVPAAARASPKSSSSRDPAGWGRFGLTRQRQPEREPVSGETFFHLPNGRPAGLPVFDNTGSCAAAASRSDTEKHQEVQGCTGPESHGRRDELQVLSAPASWGAAPRKAKAVTAEPL